MDGIRIVLDGDRNSSHLIPTWQNYNILQSVAAVLIRTVKRNNWCSAWQKCIIIPVVKLLLSHLISELLLEKEEDTELTKEIREQIRVDIELRYIDADFNIY